MAAQTKPKDTPRRNWVTEGVIVAPIGGIFGLLGIWLGRSGSDGHPGPTPECQSAVLAIEQESRGVEGLVRRWEDTLIPSLEKDLASQDLRSATNRLNSPIKQQDLPAMVELSEDLRDAANNLKQACL